MIRTYKNIVNSGICWWGAILLMLGMYIIAPFCWVKYAYDLWRTR